MICICLFAFLFNIVPGKPELSVEQPEAAVVVSWVLEQANGVIKEYRVTYGRVDDSSGSKTLTTKNTELQFENLNAGKTYEFQVCCIFEFVQFGRIVYHVSFMEHGVL